MATEIMPSESIIYATGCTPEGITLIGGVWKLWEQEGFPIEMSHMVCRDKGWRVDWLEAMADASRTNNCPAIVKHMETLLPIDAMTHIKLGFMAMVSGGDSYEKIMADKQANGRAFLEFVYAALAAISSRDRETIAD